MITNVSITNVTIACKNSVHIVTLSGQLSLGKGLLQYFFGYKIEFFSFKNNLKHLDLSDLCKLFRKGKTHITAKFHTTVVFVEKGKPHLIVK